MLTESPWPSRVSLCVRLILVAALCGLVAMGGCRRQGVDYTDGGEGPDCSRSVGCEIDIMVCNIANGTCEEVHELGEEPEVSHYTNDVLNTILWDDTVRVCMAWAPDEIEIPYQSLGSGDLLTFATNHRNAGELTHLISAVSYENTSDFGKSLPYFGYYSYIFTLNLLNMIKQNNVSNPEGVPMEYEYLKDYAVLHEIATQIGQIDYRHDGVEYKNVCVMYRWLPDLAPVSIGLCSQCSTKIADCLSAHMYEPLLASSDPDAGWASLPMPLGAQETEHRLNPVTACRLTKGLADNGLSVSCDVEGDTLVVGEPVILEFKMVNVGTETARVWGQHFGMDRGCPDVYVADPAGIEYAYVPYSWVLTRPIPGLGVDLSPGDTLSVVLHMTYFGPRVETLFRHPGRWGLYCAYQMPSDYGLHPASTVSEIDWVQVVSRDAGDLAAWAVFERAKDALVEYGRSKDASVVAALREVVDSHNGSAYYQYSLYSLGLCLMASGDCAGAMAQFERYRTEFSGSLLAGEALFHMAQCLHQLEQYQEAIAAFRQAQEETPTNWRASSRFRAKYDEMQPWKSPFLY